MIARMVFQVTMMMMVVALAIHMIVQRNHAKEPQIVSAVTNIAQPAPQVTSMAVVPTPPVAVAAAVVAQIKRATTVSTKNAVPPGKTAALDQKAPGTLEVANLPDTGEVVR